MIITKTKKSYANEIKTKMFYLEQKLKPVKEVVNLRAFNTSNLK